MNIIIVGGGKKVYFLSKLLTGKEYNVTVINNDKVYCENFARENKASIVYGDGTRPYLLKDAGIAQSDIVMALTPRDQDNLVICQLASKMYKIEKTFAIVNDPENIEIFNSLGIETVFSTAQIMSSLIGQRILISEIKNLFPIEGGQAALMEVVIPEESQCINGRIDELGLPEDAVIGCIIRGNSVIIPKKDTFLRKNDKLVIITLAEFQNEVLSKLTGCVQNI